RRDFRLGSRGGCSRGIMCVGLGAPRMRFLFGDYALDLERRELRRGAELVEVEPQVFDLLAYLVENRDRVASKDNLLAAVWHGRTGPDSPWPSRIPAARRPSATAASSSASYAPCPAAASGSSARCASSPPHRPPARGIISPPTRNPPRRSPPRR